MLGPLCEPPTAGSASAAGGGDAGAVLASDEFAAVLASAWAGGKPPPPLHPWWRGFTGAVVPTFEGKTAAGAAAAAAPAPSGVITVGRAAWDQTPAKGGRAASRKDALSDEGADEAGAGPGGATAVRITELPVGRWTEEYKAFLHGLAARGSLKSVRGAGAA